MKLKQTIINIIYSPLAISRSDCKCIIWFVVCLSIFRASYAKDFGITGRAYEIKEQNIVQYIKNNLDNKEVDKINQDFKKRVISKTHRPDEVKGITKATKSEIHYFDPTITLTKDIVDHNGKILYPKGTKVNPLDHQDFTRQLLFIDGDDKEQVGYALSKYQQIGEDLKIVLVRGSIIDLMKKHQTRLYFDQQGYLTGTFGITQVPSIASKDKDLIKIETIVLSDDYE